MSVIEKIKSILNSKKISTYRINVIEKSSVELFYILHKVDMARSSDITEISVIVYRDFEHEGTKMRGNAAALIYPDMTENEIGAALEEAYYAAGFVKNKFYEIPNGVSCEVPETCCYDLQAEAVRMAKAIFEAEDDKDVMSEAAFINSAEIFAYKSKIRVINSNAVDVSYSIYDFEGEFVAESKANGQDVEIHSEFSYNTPDKVQLSKKVKEALKTVKDRAEATMAPEGGKYDVLLTDVSCAALLDYYTARATGAYIYAGYSSYALDCMIQGNDVMGEKLNIELKAVSPYSVEGIPMKDRILAQEGILKTITCGSRFGYYLGVEPTGDYSCVECKNGSENFENMKQGALQIAAFSDFQVDPLSGQFGGEIRLAYLYEKNEKGYTVKKLTGGCINGNIIEAGKNMLFSKEKYVDKSYNGPYAVRLKDVSVAGN